MKIAVFLESKIEAGGGFNQSLNAVMQMKKICEGRYDLMVVTSSASNIKFLKELGITNTVIIKITWLDIIYEKLKNIEIINFFFKKINLLSQFEKSIKKSKVDLIYFTSTPRVAGCLQKTGYIATLWDCAHRYYPEFPEVNSWGEYEKRERLLKKILPKSIAVLTDSDNLSTELNKNYCVDNQRLIAMPFLPPQFMNYEIDQNPNKKFLEKLGIEKGFFLYPAMFWPHKNHIRIIHALIHLRKTWGSINNIKIIFTGSNKGNLGFINDEIKKNGLQNNVIILNFVSKDLLDCLYLNSRALIMPTYFGQTNIPPLEAWVYGKPVIYSEHISSGIEGSVIQVDPDNEVSISDAIIKVMNCSDESKYIDIGKRAIEKQMLEIQKAEKLLLNALISFEKRRVLWDR